VHDLVWSAGGDRLATGDNEGNARLLEVTSGQVLASHQHRGSVLGLALSPDAQRLASGGNDGAARVTTVGGPEKVLVGHDQPVLAVAFSRDGRLLITGSADRTVRVWDVDTGIPRVLRGHADQVLDVGFAPGGQTVWSASLDGLLRFAPVAELVPLPTEPAALRAALGRVTSFTIEDRAGAPALRGEPR
jgi:WD40 repeat protein